MANKQHIFHGDGSPEVAIPEVAATLGHHYYDEFNGDSYLGWGDSWVRVSASEGTVTFASGMTPPTEKPTGPQIYINKTAKEIYFAMFDNFQDEFVWLKSSATLTEYTPI